MQKRLGLIRTDRLRRWAVLVNFELAQLQGLKPALSLCVSLPLVAALRLDLPQTLLFKHRLPPLLLFRLRVASALLLGMPLTLSLCVYVLLGLSSRLGLTLLRVGIRIAVELFLGFGLAVLVGFGPAHLRPWHDDICCQLLG